MPLLHTPNIESKRGFFKKVTFEKRQQIRILFTEITLGYMFDNDNNIFVFIAHICKMFIDNLETFSTKLVPSISMTNIATINNNWTVFTNFSLGILTILLILPTKRSQNKVFRFKLKVYESQN